MSRNPEDKYDVIHLATEASTVQRTSIRVLPKDLSPGAREVALLTAVTKAQAEHIVPMAEALQSLKDKGPDIWQGQFLVAAGEKFDWRTAPWRRYASFEDFYDQELAPVYGAYEEFLQTADRVVRGELSAEEGASLTRKRATAQEHVDAAPPRERINDQQAGGRIPKGDKDNRDNITVRGGDSGGGTSAEYLTRRIVRDHPEIAEKMRNGEYKSVRAAALDAKIVHPTTTIRTDNAASIVATLRRQLDPEILAMVTKLLTEEWEAR
jgi:hypothetical protein